ncbi:hypothetical protein VTJ04DRAFT_1606 [Mycothermus thermophilus]|uniref:uncharacterized protein n=1 Tax=Humicola insolens TaxID=85995 RepID=UPI003743DEE9
MIQGIFYARFFPEQGTKIVAQSPPGCITPEPGASKPPLFDFKVLEGYIIPREAFRNRYITITDPDGKYCVLGFPVSINNPRRYFRNEFIFNFGLVVETDVDQVPYEQVVRRLAATFAEMEKQSGYLSSQEGEEGGEAEGGGGGGGDGAVDVAGTATTSNGTTTTITTSSVAPPPNNRSDLLTHKTFTRRPISSLLEIVREDLNNYGECMIPVDDANAINMKLFPHHPTPPPEVKGWHVPVAKTKFADIVDPTWDLTLQRVVAHIDGVSDVRRIAARADVSLELCQLALRHLLYYDTILLLDMFFFGACYAPRPGIHDFVANVGGMVDECANYVCIGPGPGRAAAAATAAGEKEVGGCGCADCSNERRRRDARGRGRRSRGHDSEDEDSQSGEEDDEHDDDDETGSTPRHHHHPRLHHRRHHHPHYPHPHDHQHHTPSDHGHDHHQPHTHPRVSNYTLIRLMTTFCAGKTVADWIRQHMETGLDVLRLIDVRRFVQFGVIKGCLYRVHKHVVSKQYLAALATGQARPVAAEAGGDPLQKYTDGVACFDQIITEQDLTEGEILERLKGFRAPAGDLTVLYY